MLLSLSEKRVCIVPNNFRHWYFTDKTLAVTVVCANTLASSNGTHSVHWHLIGQMHPLEAQGQSKEDCENLTYLADAFSWLASSGFVLTAFFLLVLLFSSRDGLFCNSSMSFHSCLPKHHSGFLHCWIPVYKNNSKAHSFSFWYFPR